METSTRTQSQIGSIVVLDPGPRIPFTLMDALSLTLALIFAALFLAAYLRAAKRQKNAKK